MLEFELFVAVLLLVAIVVLLSVLVYKVADGFRVTFNYLDEIKSFECHYPERAGADVDTE